MSISKTLATLAALTLAATGPAFAGQSDDAGRKGDLVQDSKSYWKGKNGASGWGQRVSDKANGTVDNPDGSLGGYLKRMTPNENSGRK